MYIYIYMYVCMYIYIYIYIYGARISAPLVIFPPDFSHPGNVPTNNTHPDIPSPQKLNPLDNFPQTYSPSPGYIPV